MRTDDNLLPNCGSYNKPLVTDPDFSTSSLECLTCDPAVIATHYFNQATKECVSRTVIANCVAYFPAEDMCQTCEVNYKLADFKDQCMPLPGAILDAAPVFRGYMQTCQVMDACNEEVSYDGLSHTLNSLLSCHQCRSAIQIPYLAVKSNPDFSSIFGLQGYGFDMGGAQKFYQAPTAQPSVFCADLGFNLPSNCGVGIINTNSLNDFTDSGLTSGVDRSRIAYVCGACKPGFRPTHSTDLASEPIDIMVGACTEIANCETSQWFNGCSQCQSFHAYRYTDEGLDFGTCVDSTDNQACYAVRADGVCVFCARGYFLNKDGFCEQIHPPRCDFGQFRFRELYKPWEYNVGFFLSKSGLGCTLCDNEYVGLYQPEDLYACTESAYHSNELVLEDSKYLFQCLHYVLEPSGRLLCKQCAADHVLTSKGSCVINTNVQGCVLASNGDICLRCTPELVLIQNQCEESTIASCLHYAPFNSSSQICVRCENGFYLRDNSCTAGRIGHCEVYETEISCNKCESGFAPILKDGAVSKCMKMEQRFNCLKLDFVALSRGFFRCL